jgi:murein DD-endopeptidase MepM/ murein hydrolase activator NlpD
MKKTAFSVLVLILITWGPLLVGAVEIPTPNFPLIARLEPGDGLFSQYLADVESARRRLFGGNGLSMPALAESLTIYAYTLASGEDLLRLAARCNVPYAALATLNRLPHASALASSGTVLLPSMPGLFIPETPQSDLEQLLRSTRDDTEGVVVTVRYGGRREQFRFIPGADFSPTERTFFLNANFRFPLRNYRITSSYGPRVNPITGNLRLHQGLDLAAPLGTEVFATRDGVVIDRGEDGIYGKYIILQHGDNWVSLYGHLSEFNVLLRDEVRSGGLLGKVGSTGQSTGPHLHFELRQSGRAQDPGKYLFRDGRP